MTSDAHDPAARRSTLDDDVLAAARVLARQQRTSLGAVISAPARQGLVASGVDFRFFQQPLEALLRRGVPAVAGGVPGGIEVAAPLGIRFAAGVAPLAEVEHQGLRLLR